MSNYHKPRTFRSLLGCCICKAKSSTSRFTDSDKYKLNFRKCFRVYDDRTGDICNACVLLIKRWKKLPRGSKKSWSHVVDARAVPGTSHKNATALVRQRSKTHANKEDPDLKIRKIIKSRATSAASFSQSKTSSSRESRTSHPGACESPTITETSEDVTDNDSQAVSSFLDLAYWKRTKVCCGVVFIGQNNDLAIDVNLYRPCSLHGKKMPPMPLCRANSNSSAVSSASNSVGAESIS
ncbi:SIN3-HDAC complex-associated factor-like [Watersipora subatra]|uniref:SIN3-HDAC complex-associated factor-like n=1 Tax=Watersipora subatra TaxID=2589382 RepID=UPI00355BA7E8